MTRTLVSSRSDAALTLEAGGWVAYRRPQPRIAADALDLLDRSAAPRRGNLRFALHGRSVCLVGELRACSLPQAEQYFGVTAARPSEEMDAVDVACVLHETGHAWCQPPNVGDRWQTVAHGSRDPAWALTATLVPGGVQVASRLAPGDAPLGGMPRLAIARYLVLAHVQLRFVRFSLQADDVTALSFAAAERLDVELPDSVSAVLAACRSISREVQALTHDTVAAAYLESTE